MNNKFKIDDVVTCVNGRGWEHTEIRYGCEYVLVEHESVGHEGNLFIKYAEQNAEDFKISKEDKKQEYYSLKHYDTFYYLTDKDIESGKIKIDAYFVAKQWKVGSKDDSGALFHNLKTIARFGEKNSVEREIKALYNQTLALARIYEVDLEGN